MLLAWLIYDCQNGPNFVVLLFRNRSPVSNKKKNASSNRGIHFSLDYSYCCHLLFWWWLATEHHHRQAGVSETERTRKPPFQGTSRHHRRGQRSDRNGGLPRCREIAEEEVFYVAIIYAYITVNWRHPCDAESTIMISAKTTLERPCSGSGDVRYFLKGLTIF